VSGESYTCPLLKERSSLHSVCSMPYDTTTGRRGSRLGTILVLVNPLWIAFLVFVEFGPARTGIAADIRLWHECEINPASTHGTGGWTGYLLLALIPFIAGLVVGIEERRGSLFWVALAGSLLVLAIWLIPTGTCIS
jgi:hypothetical protein